MSRIKLVFAALLITAIVSVVPLAHAANGVPQVILSGSSALWQSLALAAYNSGHCVTGGTAPCFHYTNKASPGFQVTDNRPTVFSGGVAASDSAPTWIVWDSSSPPKVWAMGKVDSGVGDRCYFAQPHCTLNVATFPAAGNVISSTLWGDSSSDSTPPATVSDLFSPTGTPVSGAATDIRPEDALFATCRSNSALSGVVGLGYNSHNAAGTCPAFGATLAQLEGAAVESNYPGSTATAHLLAWALSGKDPFTGTAIPAATTVSVGATPVVFVISREGALKNVVNVNDTQLHTVFGGTTCTGTPLNGTSGDIQVYLREPVSGTMNTTEFTVFAYKNLSGVSQETGVAAQNPLDGKCTGGSRHRAIGTGEEVESVQNSNTNNSTDGIGYTFFSYGNVSPLADSVDYRYLTLDGIDGIFHKQDVTGLDPGEPAGAGTVPSATDLPASCSHAFPCPEADIWSGHLSFPNLRNGSYRAWSLLRLVSNGAALTAAEALVAGSQTYAVKTVPDYVPALAVAGLDPGLQLLRSHYLQEGVSPVNIATTGDKGGDAGGCILSSSGVAATSDTTVNLVQAAPLTPCVQVP